MSTCEPSMLLFTVGGSASAGDPVGWMVVRKQFALLSTHTAANNTSFE